MHQSTRVGPILAVGVLVACGSTVEPEAVEGTWYLHAYNDSAVPGRAVFHAGNDSSVIEIDSVRLQLAAGAQCSWLVDLANEPANAASSCVWSLDADPDDLMVTIDGEYVLRGDAMPALLRLRDPNDNTLQFERDPAVPGPEEPHPL
jgi:hypothetical protein